MAAKTTLQERFDRFVMPIPFSGCWLWTGYLFPNGYGNFRARHKKPYGTGYAHRWSWLLHKGPIPPLMNVCHRCDVPDCVNPEHLFLGTQKENIKDMISKGRKFTTAPKTHCVNGHEFTVSNTGRHPNGTKRCRQCGREALTRMRRAAGMVQRRKHTEAKP